MKFKLNEAVLTEGKNIDKTWEKYKDKWIKNLNDNGFHYNEDASKKAWMQLISIDPTYKEGTGVTGDFGEWLTRMHLAGGINWMFDRSSLPFMTELLSEFIRKKPNLEKKDINQYKSTMELYNVLERTDYSDRQKERMLRNSKDIKLVYSDNYWKIYEPLSFAGSCTLGKGTDWCTAHSDVPEHYEHYTSDGDTLLVIVDADNPNIKYQYSTKLGEFKNTDDLDEDLESVFMHHPKVIDFIKTNYPAGGEELEKILADAFHTSPYEMRTALDNGEIYKIPNATNPEEVGKFLVDNEYVEDFFGDEEWWQYKPDGSVDWESMMDDDDGQWAFASNGNAYQWAI